MFITRIQVAAGSNHKLHKKLCPIVILLGRKQAPVCLDLEISHTTSIELKENDSKERKKK